CRRCDVAAGRRCARGVCRRAIERGAARRFRPGRARSRRFACARSAGAVEERGPPPRPVRRRICEQPPDRGPSGADYAGPGDWRAAVRPAEGLETERTDTAHLTIEPRYAILSHTFG